MQVPPPRFLDTRDEGESATMEWVCWFKHRPLEPPGCVPLGKTDATHREELSSQAIPS